ncbi:TATA box-binding protein-associated factor RNA polymerase I subunit A isoform X2 [Pleurodeles waltl]
MEESMDECGEEMPQMSLPRIRLPYSHRHHPYKKVICGKRKGFLETAEVCLDHIREALFQNQWQRAAELMNSYFQSLENSSATKLSAAKEVIWKLGTEILLHHPKSKIDDINLFADRMKNLGVNNYLKVCLEHVFHLLCNGLTEDAYLNLTVAQSWRYGSKSQEKTMKLIQAYRALLDYQRWSYKRCATLENELDYLSEAACAQEMASYFKQATGALNEIIKVPGVWDIFVQSYADLLEFHGDQEAARSLLTDYAYDNKYPANPNAHVYLYAFLKRNGESKKSLIEALKILHQLVPSHELMLELNTLLQESGMLEHQELGLRVIFEVLDYSAWKEHLETWACLAKQMKAAIQGEHLEWIHQEWDSRNDWWPAYHFSHFQAKKDCQQNERLAMKKAFVAGILLGKGCTYFSFVCKSSRQCRKETKRLKKFVKKHALPELG